MQLDDVHVIDGYAVSAIKWILGFMAGAAAIGVYRFIRLEVRFAHLAATAKKLERRDEAHHDALLRACHELGIDPPREVLDPNENGE